MNKFNVGDLVNFGARRSNVPYTVIHIHQAPNDKRVWYVCAYRGNAPHIKEADELSLHTAAKNPTEEGLLRDLNLKPGDVVELVSFGDAAIHERELSSYKGKKWTVGPEGRTILLEDGGRNSISTSRWVYRVVSRYTSNPAKWGDWVLGQAPRETPLENVQVSHGPDGGIVAYRVKVEPKVGEFETFFHIANNGDLMVGRHVEADTHKITFNTVDGEPDCASIKMEKL